MFWSVVALVFSVLLDLLNLGRLSIREKDLEILILRHQLDILERKQTHPIRPSKAEKLTPTVLTNKPKTMSNCSASQLHNVVRIFQEVDILAAGFYRDEVFAPFGVFAPFATFRSPYRFPYIVEKLSTALIPGL